MITNFKDPRTLSQEELQQLENFAIKNKIYFGTDINPLVELAYAIGWEKGLIAGLKENK